MSTRHGWVRTSRAAAVATIVTALLAATAVLLTARELSQLEADREARAAAANAVAPVSEALRTLAGDAESGTGPTAKQVEVANAGSAGISEASAIRARDTGSTVLDDSRNGLVVVATYDTPTPPASVEARRQHVTGLRVMPLRMTSTLNGLRPSNGGISLAGPDRLVLSRPGPEPSDATTYTVEVATRVAPHWTLTVWTTSAGVPLLAWAVALGIVLTGVACAVWIVRRGDRLRRERQELARLQEASDRVAALAIVAQRSLDLADVLPAITTDLAAALGLRGLSLATPTADGERLLFAWGDDPGEVPTSRALPAEVAADEALSLMLSRGGRTVARMTVLAGRDLDGHDVGTIGAVAEVLSSALANAEAFSQQRELVQRMRSLDELKTVFLATASHELRTPVTAITGYARILVDSWDKLSPEQARMFADRVDGNAHRLSGLVESLLDFSRLERGMGSAADSLLDLGEVVSRILDEQPDLAADHQLAHRTVNDLGVTGSVQAVERVVTNLVGNAAKYSPVGTTIRVSVRENGGRVELAVGDEGPGVPSAEREQIFSRFFRGSGDATVSTSGAGLGLAIVSEFAASMGGRVSVTTADSGGALFVVSYPLASSLAVTSEGEAHVHA